MPALRFNAAVALTPSPPPFSRCFPPPACLARFLPAPLPPCRRLRRQPGPGRVELRAGAGRRPGRQRQAGPAGERGKLLRSCFMLLQLGAQLAGLRWPLVPASAHGPVLFPSTHPPAGGHHERQPVLHRHRLALPAHEGLAAAARGRRHLHRQVSGCRAAAGPRLLPLLACCYCRCRPQSPALNSQVPLDSLPLRRWGWQGIYVTSESRKPRDVRGQTLPLR